MWNCTHFRHPTDEQLGHVDIFFSNYYNLQSVYFELQSLLRENGRLLLLFIKKKNKFGDRMIKQFLTSVIAKYRDLSVSRRSIICRSRIIDLLATDKSRYFAQPRPIVVNYHAHFTSRAARDIDA